LFVIIVIGAYFIHISQGSVWPTLYVVLDRDSDPSEREVLQVVTTVTKIKIAELLQYV